MYMSVTFNLKIGFSLVQNHFSLYNKLIFHRAKCNIIVIVHYDECNIMFYYIMKNDISQGKVECNIFFLRAIKMILYEAKCNICFIICQMQTKYTAF